MDWGAWATSCGWIFPIFCLAMMLIMVFCIFSGSRCFHWRWEEKKEDEVKELRKEIAELKEMVKGLKEKIDKEG